MYDQKIKSLSVDEYFYLTENLESVNAESIKSGVGFIVHNRRQRIVDIIRQIIENELTDFERAIVTEHLCNGVSAVELQKKFRVSHSGFYRSLENAKNKIKSSMKYVLLYDKTSIPLTAEGLLEYVRKSEH